VPDAALTHAALLSCLSTDTEYMLLLYGMALHRQDQDTPTPHVVVLQERRGAGTRWKLCALTEADCYSFIEV
jgi:hypothetical protein